MQGIANTTKAALDRLQASEDRLNAAESGLGKLSTAFVNFRTQTTKALQAHGVAIAGLQGAVGELRVSVTRVEARLDVQERNGAVVADFVFSQMHPGAKAQALKNGFLAERFACHGETLDSQLKCDTEVCGERLDRGAVAEALARR